MADQPSRKRFGFIPVILIVSFVIFGLWLVTGGQSDTAPTPASADSPSTDAYAPPPLFALIPKCPPDASCGDDVFQKVWRRVDSENGEVTFVDLKSIQGGTTGSVMVVVYTSVPNTDFDGAKLRRVLFDCAGHFSDVTEMSSSTFDAPPRSVIGTVANIVCGPRSAL